MKHEPKYGLSGISLLSTELLCMGKGSLCSIMDLSSISGIFQIKKANQIPFDLKNRLVLHQIGFGDNI